MTIMCGVKNAAKALLRDSEKMEQAEEKALPLKAKVKSFAEFEKHFEMRKIRITFTQELSDFDKQVLVGICNLWYSGRRFITADQIIDAVWEWRLETMNDFRRRCMVNEIVKSVEKLLSTRMEAKKLGRNGFRLMGWLLQANMSVISYRTVGGWSECDMPINELIEIEREPLISSEWRGQHICSDGKYGVCAADIDEGKFPDLD